MVQDTLPVMETLRYVVLANGLLAVVSVAYYVLLRRETFFGANRLALWLGLAGVLLLPLLELPDWRPQPVRSVMRQTAQAIVPRILPNPDHSPDVTITFPDQQTYRAFRAQQKRFVWSWQLGLSLTYIAALALLLIRFSIQLFSLRKLIRQSAHVPYDDFVLVSNTIVTSPFSFFNWVVLNPDQHTPDELDQILRHERVHVQERHSIDMLAAEFVCIMFWFNPAAYLFRHLLHETLEFSADRAVLAEGIDAKAYQYNLLKVSLSAGQSALTNHFSKAQLKSRIVMLNQPNSSKSTWLKYPVFFIAALTVASAFARPQHVRALGKYIPEPVVETIEAVLESPKKKGQALIEQRYTNLNLTKLPARQLKKNPSVSKGNISFDSTSQLATKDSPRVSSCRYMIYQGDYLYWIVTPKTTFDDFTVMKKEFEKQGYNMQLNELKYDPLYTYIDRVSITVVGSTSSRIRVNELDDDLKPIPTIAGYVNIKNTQISRIGSSRLNGRYSKNFPLYQTEAEEEFPDMLRNVANDDEALISQFIDNKKMDYLILSGEQKYGHLGIGFRKFDQKAIKKQSSSNSIIRVDSGGSLSIGNEMYVVKAFINNEPVTPEAIHRLNISQLYTVAVILGYDNAMQKRSGIDYLLFYVNENQ